MFTRLKIYLFALTLLMELMVPMRVEATKPLSPPGFVGGSSIFANTLTFGATDYLGWTDSSQYQGWEYDLSRASATVAQGALIGLGTAGIGTAASAGNTTAQIAYQGILVAGAAQGGYQVGSGINSVAEGNYLAGGAQIAGGAFSIAGSMYGAKLTAAQSTTTALSPYRYTGSGEAFIRYESGNPAFTKITPSGVKPQTFAAPASDGLIPIADRVSVYNLPSPHIQRPNAITLTPPPGTPIIGPRPVMGGTGNEVIFPMGY